MMRKKKVAIFMNYPAHYTDCVLNHLFESEDISFDVIYYNRIPTDHIEWKREEKTGSHIFYCKKSYRIVKGEYYNPDAIVLFLKGKYDLAIISGRMPITSFHLLRICRRLRIPYIFAADTAMLPIGREVEDSERNKFKKHYDGIIRESAGIWTPGLAGAAWWTEIYGKEIADKIVTGRYLLDNESIQITHSRNEARKSIRDRYEIDEKEFVILFVGGLTKERSIKTLLRIQNKLYELDRQFHLMVIGYGEESGLIKEYMKEYPDRLCYIESVPYKELNAYYFAADGYVHPGKEPYSLAVVQSVLNCIPTIATDCVGAAYDYIVSDRNGYMTPFGNDEELTQAVVNIMDGKISVKTCEEECAKIIKYRNGKSIAGDLVKLINVSLENR